MSGQKSRFLAKLVIIVCASALAAATTFTDSGVAQAASVASAPVIASSYSGALTNTTYDVSSTWSLTDVVDSGGSLTGQANINPPLYGSGPFTGTVTGDSISFNVQSEQPNAGNAASIDFDGTIASDGSMSGTYQAHATSGQEEDGVWNLALPSPTCEANYQTVVTEHAGNDNGLPELYSDTVTFSWCTDGSSQVQILSSSQTSSVEASGVSFSGAQIALLKLAGITFGVTPATAPAPTIDNESSYAATTASGVSFTEEFNLGEDLVDLLLKPHIIDRLAERVLRLIRSGHLGRVAKELQQGWTRIVAAFDSWAAKNFGLPDWAATWVANLPIGQIKDAIASLAEKFVSTVAQSLEALGSNPTLASVINSVQSGIQKIASALDYTTVDWAPYITVTVGSSLAPSVDDANSKVGFDIIVENPIVTTTRTS